MKEDLPQAALVTSAIEVTQQLIKEGATDAARENLMTILHLNGDLLDELVSDDEVVWKRAATFRLPPGMNMLTYATSPLIYLYRLLRDEGDAVNALQVSEMAIKICSRLAPFSSTTAACLEEAAVIAFRAGDNEYANLCNRQAHLLRELIGER